MERINQKKNNRNMISVEHQDEGSNRFSSQLNETAQTPDQVMHFNKQSKFLTVRIEDNSNAKNDLTGNDIIKGSKTLGQNYASSQNDQFD